MTADDIKELFSTTGALVSHRLLFDSADRSTGVAEVVYRERSAALQAIHEYDNIALDGQKLSIKLVEGAAGVLSRLSRWVGGWVGRSRGDGGGVTAAALAGMADAPAMGDRLVEGRF